MFFNLLSFVEEAIGLPFLKFRCLILRVKAACFSLNHFIDRFFVNFNYFLHHQLIFCTSITFKQDLTVGLYTIFLQCFVVLIIGVCVHLEF